MANVVVTVNGRDITFDDSDAKAKKLLAQINNAEEEQRQTVYASARSTFVDAAKMMVDEQTTGLADELAGQTLIYDMSADKVILADSKLVSIKQRVSKKATPWYTDLPTKEGSGEGEGEGNKGGDN